MATVEELRDVYRSAEDVISAIFETLDSAERWHLAKDVEQARKTIHALYRVENATRQLTAGLNQHGRIFAAVNHAPVELWQPPAASAHEAVRDAGVETGNVGIEFLWAAFPETKSPGESKYIEVLPQEEGMVVHIATIVKAVFDSFPSWDQLNRAGVLCEQELARALQFAEPDEPEKRTFHSGWDAATEARNKWIYEHCMKGTTYSSIIKRLAKKPATWERITSTNGIKDAAKAYAERFGLDLPPARQNGRKRPK